MMNHIVPDDFEAEEEYLIQELPKKSTMGGNEDVMELLWHNGQVVMQNQNQRSSNATKKAETRSDIRDLRSATIEDQGTGPSDVLFMQEDEMASWLHYPSDENSLENYLYNNDLLYPTVNPSPPPTSVMIPSSSPPVPVYRRTEVESGPTKYTNFLHFGRPNKISRTSSGPESLLGLSASASKITPTLAVTGVASNKTPVLESRASRVSDKPTYVSGGGGSVSGIIGVSTGKKMETCEMSVTSSHDTGGSGESAGMEPSTQKPPPPIDDRKRKGRDTDDNECHSEDVEFDAKSKSRGGSTSTKRSRAAEVHNLSERRRRDRINEKMKALQELIPCCNKSDKASMLDEAIEYLKSLQMQLQMMSMGCSMVPMMYPGVQQYVPPMAMGMGMGMGIDMGMNRPIVPYPAILPASSMPNPAAVAAAHLGQRFPVPGYNISPVPVAGPAASQAANISAPIMNSFPLHSQNQPRVPNFTDPFQQYHAVQQTQVQLPQGQGLGGMPPIAIKPRSSSKDATNPDHRQTG